MEHLKKVIAAADFYEPRMAAAFLRGVKELQDEIGLEDLARQIALRQSNIVSSSLIQDAFSPAMAIARRAAVKGVEIGNEVVDAFTK